MRSALLFALAFCWAFFSLVARPRADVCYSHWVSQHAGTVGGSYRPAVSADGRFVAFESGVPDLVAGDTNGKLDIFVRDRETGSIERISVASDGSQASGHSYLASISADGRYVAFWSEASDLVPNDTNNWVDAFVHDRSTGLTVRVSVATDGTEAADPQLGFDVSYYRTAISSDGRFVAFTSFSPNLDPSDGHHGPDVFVRDVQNGTTERVSIALDGGEGLGYDPVMSADGRFVAFASTSANLVASPDTNDREDVFVRDRMLGITRRVSLDSDGVGGNNSSFEPSISADGRYVAFHSFATNLAPGMLYPQFGHMYVRDRVTNTTYLGDVGSFDQQGNGDCMSPPALSADGRKLAFASRATNLVGAAGSTLCCYWELYLHDFDSGVTSLQSAITYAAWPIGSSPINQAPAFSADGRYLAFNTNERLSPADTNNSHDVYVRDLGASGTYTTHCSDETAPCPCGGPALPGAGCGNSSMNGGAFLRAGGTPSVAADTVMLQCSGMAAMGVTVVFIQGAIGTMGTPLGDGLLCVGGSVLRLATKAAQWDEACFGYGVETDPLVSVKGGVPPTGGTRFYQAWYRDPLGVCGATSNLTNGISIVWSP